MGGGSLVYANTLLVPPRPFYKAPAWEDLDPDWKCKLAPHYETAKKMLGVTRNPKLTFVDHLLKECAEDMGRGETSLLRRRRLFKVPDLLPPDYVTAVRESAGGRCDRRSTGTCGPSSRRPTPGCSTPTSRGPSSSPAPRPGRRSRSRPSPTPLRDRYGRTRFGQSCLLARRLIERGVRFVTVNMFETVFNEITWDIHGSAPFSPIECYKNEVGPNFDNAYTALLEDLQGRGMLETTMVLAFGEFGRTPKINPAGGRDHHPACWTVLFAGGSDQGRPGRRRVRRDRLRPQGPPGHHRRDRRHGLPGPGHRPRRPSCPARRAARIRLVDHGVEPIEELF